MNHILIPTDFSKESLQVLEDYLISCPYERVTVLFFHVIKLSDSITDLLLLSRRTKETEIIPNSFKNYCACIQDEFSKVDEVHFQYFYGHTMALFRNFIEANQIDLIVYDPRIKMEKLSKASIDPYEIINKSRCQKWQRNPITKSIRPADDVRQLDVVPSSETIY